MHVVNNLSAFLMFEVMESAWQTLLEAVHRACCLDDVIRAHDAYLGEIMDRALLAPQHESINMQVPCRAVPCHVCYKEKIVFIMAPSTLSSHYSRPYHSLSSHHLTSPKLTALHSPP